MNFLNRLKQDTEITTMEYTAYCCARNEYKYRAEVGEVPFFVKRLLINLIIAYKVQRKRKKGF